MNPLVTIVIPVFNAEKTVKRCIKSLVAQTYSNIEIILIDDGSKDNSLSICQEFQLNDRRVKVFHHENRGVSATRNRGIEMASGDFIAFVDADDYVDADMYRLLMEKQKEENSDIVFCNYIIEQGRRSIEKYEIPVMGSSSDLRREIICRMMLVNQNNIMGSCWRSIFSTRFLVENHIIFDTELRMSEDLKFMLEATHKAQRISTIAEPLYHYTVAAGGSTTQRYLPKMFEYFQLVDDWREVFVGQNVPELSQMLLLAKANAYIGGVRNISRPGTPYTLQKRIEWSKTVRRTKKMNQCIRYAVFHKNGLMPNAWLGCVLAWLRLDWLLIVLFALKNRTLSCYVNYFDFHSFAYNCKIETNINCEKGHVHDAK